MSRFDALSPEIQSLIQAACTEEATQTQLSQLEELIDSDSTMRLLIDYLQLDGELRRIICQQASEDKCLESLGMGHSSKSQPTQQHSVLPRFTVPSLSLRSAATYLSSGWPMAYLIATVVVGMGIAIAAITYVSNPMQVAMPSGPVLKPRLPLPTVVGRITGMADCQWSAGSGSDPSNPTDEVRHLKSRVSVGDGFNIRSGLLEITYDNGAKVILHGPVTYEVDSADGGYLSVGKLTARLEKNEETIGFSFLLVSFQFAVRGANSHRSCHRPGH